MEIASCLNRSKFVSYQPLCIALTWTLFQFILSVFEIEHSNDTLPYSVKAILSIVFLFFMFANAACGAIYVLFFSLLLSQLSLSFEPYQTCQLVGSGNHRNVQESSMAGSKLGSLEANTGI